MKTLDLKTQFKYLFAPSAKKVEIIQVPRLQFAIIGGAIKKASEPGKSSAFAEATQALYSISYTLKFMLKKRRINAVDYPVMALEGLWCHEIYLGDPRKANPAKLKTMLRHPIKKL